MKKMLVALLMVPLAALAQSEPTKPLVTVTKKVVCGDLTQLFKEIGEVKEIPFWAGSDKDSYYGLFVNEKTREWTLVQFNNEIGCVLGVGGKHTHIFLPNS